LIYEKLRLDQGYSQALSLALVQMLFLLFVSTFISSPSRGSSIKNVNYQLLKGSLGLLVPFASSLIVLFGLVFPLFKGLGGIFKVYSALELLNLSLGSLLLGFGVGAVCFVLLSYSCYLYREKWLHHFLRGYVSPSSAITAFAFLLIFPNSPPWIYAKIIIAISLVTLTVVYRLFVDDELINLMGQSQVAESMGSSRRQTFMWVIYPQMKKNISYAAGVAGFWAVGDFALSSLLAHNDFSLGLSLRTLLSSYRIETAGALAWLVLLCGLIVLLVFWSLGNVRSQKFKI